MGHTSVMAIRTAMKAPTGMKVMKAKRTSKIGKGRLAKAMVLRGSKEKTVGGLKAKDLMKNKYGKIVSRKRSAAGRKLTWPKSIQQARKALSIKGFFAVGGKSPEGKALYAKAKAISSN